MSDTDQDPLKIDVAQISAELKIRPEIYVKIVRNFANSLPGKMRSLSEALAVNDNDLMRMTLHEIKGTAGNLRLKNIIKSESLMHAAVKAGESPSNLEQLFQDLKCETEKLLQYVQKLAA